MSRTDSDDESKAESTENTWTLARRRLLQLGGAGIIGLGALGGTANVASAATDCADGPFKRAYFGDSVTFSEIPSPEGPSPSPNETAVAPAPADPVSEGLKDSERKTIKQQGPPKDAQRADSDRIKTARRPDAGKGNGLEIGSEYDGINAEGTRGGVPSDSQIATGSEYNLHAVNQQVAMFEKESGDQELKVRLEDIWESVIPEPDGGFVSGDPFVFDPRARYDRGEDRYVLCAVQSVQGIDENGNVITREEIEEGADGPGPGDDDGDDEGEGEDGGKDAPGDPGPRPPKGYFLVAVSATSDPTGEWYVYRLPPEDSDGPDNLGLVDYPQLGLDRDAIYLSQNFFPYAGDPNQTVRPTIVALDKEAMYDGDAFIANHFDNLDNPADGYQDFTVQPALQPFSGGSDGTFYFTNSVFPETTDAPLASTLTHWELTDPLDDPTLRCFIVEVDSYTDPPTADQPDSDRNIDTLGRRLMNLDYNAETDSLWMAHSVAISWNGVDVRSAIRWYEIDAASRSLVQSGTYGDPGASYFIPTIGSDEDSTVIVHNVSGPDTFVQMDVAGRTTDFSRNVLQDAIVVQDGESRYDYGESETMRWGDYNGVSVDPESGNFWAVSQYSPDINIPPEADRRDPYHTRIAEVSFGQSEDGGDGGGDKKSNTLQFKGQGSYASYEFSVSGEIKPDKGITGEDSINGNSASGAVGSGSDSYVYTGTLETLTTDGNIIVTRNGTVITEDDV